MHMKDILLYIYFHFKYNSIFYLYLLSYFRLQATQNKVTSKGLGDSGKKPAHTADIPAPCTTRSASKAQCDCCALAKLL